LIRNAIHHTKEGGITLIINSNGFELQDTGPGISATEKESIFKPFYRGGAQDRNRHGIGLGLSLVQRICEREQWEIVLTDNTPVGCCFSVALKK
jgi:signal transduction histidine kinase